MVESKRKQLKTTYFRKQGITYVFWLLLFVFGLFMLIVGYYLGVIYG